MCAWFLFFFFCPHFMFTDSSTHYYITKQRDYGNPQTMDSALRWQKRHFTLSQHSIQYCHSTIWMELGQKAYTYFHRKMTNLESSRGEKSLLSKKVWIKSQQLWQLSVSSSKWVSFCFLVCKVGMKNETFPGNRSTLSLELDCLESKSTPHEIKVCGSG